MKAYKSKLKNGLRVITIPMKDTNTTTVMVMVEAGSKYEDRDNNGISHFLEHMVFQGTENRPDSGQVSYELEQLGASHNAFTGQEYTGYYAKGQSKYTKKLIELVADLYLNPLFPEDAIEREKGVIIEELNMYEDLPQRRVVENLLNLMYKDQPAGYDIIGTKENIKRFKRDDFVNYREKHYVPQATTIVIAGNVKSSNIKKEVNKYFNKLKRSKKHDKRTVKDTQKTSALMLQNKKTDQTHIALGIRAFDIKDKRNAALDVMAAVLGQGMSSRLFKKMRNELGMCYYTTAFTDLYTDHGIFGVRSGVGKKRAHEAVKVVIDELKKLKNELVDDKELMKAKNLMVGHMYMDLESSDEVAGYYGLRETLRQREKSPKELEKEIRRVSAKDIQKVAKEILKSSNMNLSAIGPFKKGDEAKFKKLMRI